jgi:hypothetical protein
LERFRIVIGVHEYAFLHIFMYTYMHEEERGD